MTTIRELSTMYASMFSLVLFMLLYESRLSQKRTMVLTLTLMGPLMLANFALLMWLGPVTMSTLILLTCSLPSLIFFWILAKHRDGRFFFTFFFADTVMLEIIDITSILDYYLGNTYYFMLLSRLIACPLIALVVYKWVRPVYLHVQNHVKTGWVTFSAIALLFYVILSQAMAVPTHILQRPEQLPVFLMLLALMPAIYTHILTTLHHQQKTNELIRHESILQLQMEHMRTQIEAFTDSDEKFRIERHDFRHKLQTAAAMLDSGKYEEARSALREYSDTLPEIRTVTYCAHPIVNTVLASSIRRAESRNIRVSTNISFPEQLTVSETELATVFSNALENAIAACEKLPREQRILEITVLQKPCFMFQIRNSFDGNVAFDEDDIPVSSDPGHGFGTRSIVTFCKKNRAFYEFKADSNFFALRISFHN